MFIDGRVLLLLLGCLLVLQHFIYRNRCANLLLCERILFYCFDVISLFFIHLFLFRFHWSLRPFVRVKQWKKRFFFLLLDWISLICEQTQPQINSRSHVFDTLTVLLHRKQQKKKTKIPTYSSNFGISIHRCSLSPSSHLITISHFCMSISDGFPVTFVPPSNFNCNFSWEFCYSNLLTLSSYRMWYI